MSKAFRRCQVQGSIDGLCGIYALVHYVERIAKFPIGRSKNKAKAAFKSLLESAENLDSPRDGKPLLSADRISTGYYTDDLVAIFNETMRRKRLPHKAWLLQDILDEKKVSVGRLIRDLIRDGANVVLQVRSGTHFVLADGIDEDDDILVRDSGHHEKYRIEELSKAPNSDDGVVIARSGTRAHRGMK